MTTLSMWKSIRSTFNLCPFSILRYDTHSNTVLWDKSRLSRLFFSYMTIGKINIFLLIAYIVYKIANNEMSPPEKAIHYALFSVVVYIWPMCLVCTYTVIGNSGICCYFYNALAHFEQSTLSKYKSCTCCTFYYNSFNNKNYFYALKL